MIKIKQIASLQSELDLKAPEITSLSTETVIADDDLISIYDTSATSEKKMTRWNFVAGLALGDDKVAVDAAATSGYIGAASSDGVLRTGSKLSYTDGGDFVTLDVAEANIDLNNCDNTTSLFITPSSTDTLVNKTFDANGTGNSISNIETTDFATNVVDTDVALTADSDTRIPSQKAIKAYADWLIGANNAMVLKGVTDCSTNPNYPAAVTWDTYKVSVAGKIGGASGENVEIGGASGTAVEVGDMIICITDNAGGTKAAVGANWSIIQTNIEGAVTTTDSSATNETLIVQDGTSGTVYKKTSTTVASLENGTGITDSLACPVTALSTNFSVTTTQTPKTGTPYTISINGATLDTAEIISFTGTTLTLNVWYAVDATDKVTATYIY